ncbi:MAG TPA: hypothetical protein VEM14_02975 [Gemmatimonadaceae bacterium]|nr:hypothetical protein [Gemmatimonadaceae bacterium]
MESSKLGFAYSLLAGIGILTTSFSLSWGLWSQYHPVSYYIDHHAFYIAATGVGLLCSLGINVSLKKRIEALESAVNQLKGRP